MPVRAVGPGLRLLLSAWCFSCPLPLLKGLVAVAVLLLDAPDHPGPCLSDLPPPAVCQQALGISCPSLRTAKPSLLLAPGFQAVSVSGESFQCHVSKKEPLLLVFALLHALVPCLYSCPTLASPGLAPLLAERSFFVPAALDTSPQPSVGPAPADLTCSPAPSRSVPVVLFVSCSLFRIALHHATVCHPLGNVPINLSRCFPQRRQLHPGGAAW